MSDLKRAFFAKKIGLFDPDVISIVKVQEKYLKKQGYFLLGIIEPVTEIVNLLNKEGYDVDYCLTRDNNFYMVYAKK